MVLRLASLDEERIELANAAVGRWMPARVKNMPYSHYFNVMLLECAVEVYPVGINTTRTVHLFTRSGTDNRRVQKVADRGHTQKCHTTPEGPRSLHAATP